MISKKSIATVTVTKPLASTLGFFCRQRSQTFHFRFSAILHCAEKVSEESQTMICFTYIAAHRLMCKTKVKNKSAVIKRGIWGSPYIFLEQKQKMSAKAKCKKSATWSSAHPQLHTNTSENIEKNLSQPEVALTSFQRARFGWRAQQKHVRIAIDPEKCYLALTSSCNTNRRAKCVRKLQNCKCNL